MYEFGENLFITHLIVEGYVIVCYSIIYTLFSTRF